jgi:hypothetical protein
MDAVPYLLTATSLYNSVRLVECSGVQWSGVERTTTTVYYYDMLICVYYGCAVYPSSKIHGRKKKE